MLAIIGGTGLYQLEGLEILENIALETPFGKPSSPIIKGKMAHRDILFLARHGDHHQFLPHEINYRANIYALKLLGATQIVGISAVGSLREEIIPGDLALPTQYFDWTKGKRISSFFGGGIAAHVSTAQPVSYHLAEWIERHARALQIKIHSHKNYGCVEGPRLGTRLESLFLRQVGCDLVGMTNIPEAFLAREAQICYATIAIATDYDCWMEDPEKHVTVNKIFTLYKQSLEKVHTLLLSMLSDKLPPEETEIRHALVYSLLTPKERLSSELSSEQNAWLSVLQK